MKKLILFACLSSLLIQNSLAQCTSRTYTPEWDWRMPSYTFITGDQNNLPVTIVKESPWFDVNHVNPNISSFRLENPKGYESTDGWVLIQRDFGTLSSPTNNPYFILYNKFSGILRIFVCVTKQFDGYTSAVITLKYKDEPSKQVVRTAALENHTTNPYRSALDNFDNQVPEINAPNFYTNDPPYWLHADFTMNYDPCTCNNLSQLIFEANLIQTADLAFQSNGTAVQDLDATGKSSGGKQSLAKTGQAVINAGNSFYKSAADAISNFNKIFPTVAAKPDVKALEKILPGLGAAVGVVDFLVGLYGGSSSKPMAYDINLTSTGTITTDAAYKTVIFENPGSANFTLVPPTKLNYNNPVGVFNLIETPQVIGSTLTGNDEGVLISERKFKLNNDLSYIINPNAGYDNNSIDLKAAFVIEFTGYTNLIDYNNNLVFEGQADGKYIYRTKFVSAGCLKDISIHFDKGFGPGYQVYVKTILTIKNSPGTITGVFVSKFKTAITYYDGSFDDASFWPGSLSNISDDLTLPPYIISNKSAWNSITVNRGLSNLGTNVSIIAGNTVTVTPGSSGSVAITAGVTIKVGTPNGCTTALAQGDPSVICNSTANTYYTKSHAFLRERANEVDSIKSKTESSFTIFPNPASNQVIFNYFIEEPSSIVLSMIDLSGNIVGQLIDDYKDMGDYSYHFDTSVLPAGLYVIKFESNKLSRTEKLVVIK